jgi:RNA polymerase-binding transcription factor DksA
MRKSKRSIRRTILVELLRHLKSAYDFELTPDAVRELIYSNSGIDALLSFRSDSRLDDLQGALSRLESGKFGICIACKQSIAQTQMDDDVTTRVCPSCEAHFNHRWVETDLHALSLQKSSIPQQC